MNGARARPVRKRYCMDHSQPDQPSWPRPAASSAIFRDGQVLIAQRSKPPLAGIWSLPGGHIEPGETAQAAALRELAEETGVEADLKGIADVADVIVRDEDGALRAHYVITAFFGVWLRGNARPGNDCLAVEWVDLADLPERRMTQATPAIIQRAAALLEGLEGQPR